MIFKFREGNYSPENVRWETQEQQRTNTRTNNKITHGDQTYTITDWSRKTGFKEATIRARIDAGWSIEEALTHPPGTPHKRQRRLSSKNRLISFNGQIKTITEWGRETGLGADRIRARLRDNWSIEKALTSPKKWEKGARWQSKQ